VPRFDFSIAPHRRAVPANGATMDDAYLSEPDLRASDNSTRPSDRPRGRPRAARAWAAGHPNPAVVALLGPGASKEGQARAAGFSAAKRSAIAGRAASARWDRNRQDGLVWMMNCTPMPSRSSTRSNGSHTRLSLSRNPRTLSSRPRLRNGNCVRQRPFVWLRSDGQVRQRRDTRPRVCPPSVAGFGRASARPRPSAAQVSWPRGGGKTRGPRV